MTITATRTTGISSPCAAHTQTGTTDVVMTEDAVFNTENPRFVLTASGNHVVAMHRTLDASVARYLAPPIAIEMRSMCGILVTPLMPGTLRSLMSSALYLPSAFVLNMWQQLNQAVAGLHRMGVIHCDIKPDNVLLAPDCTPILNDFGLSTLGVQQGSRGTPAYESPLVSHQDHVDAKDDMWACGLTMLEMAVPGRRFDYDSAEFATGLQQLAVGGQCCLINSITDFRLRAPLTAFFDLWRMAAATGLPFMWCEFAKILQDQLGGEAAAVPVYRAMISKTLLQPVLQQYYAEFDAAPVDHGATFQNLLDAVNPVPAPQPSCPDHILTPFVSPIEDDGVLAEKAVQPDHQLLLARALSQLPTPPFSLPRDVCAEPEPRMPVHMCATDTPLAIEAACLAAETQRCLQTAIAAPVDQNPIKESWGAAQEATAGTTIYHAPRVSTAQVSSRQCEGNQLQHAPTLTGDSDEVLDMTPQQHIMAASARDVVNNGQLPVAKALFCIGHHQDSAHAGDPSPTSPLDPICNHITIVTEQGGSTESLTTVCASVPDLTTITKQAAPINRRQKRRANKKAKRQGAAM
ncbi:hypothetical protein RI367_004833 [Sorochytrium milnesiophthora]